MDARRCLNCDAPLAGEYCARCGQRDTPADPTIRELAAEAWEALVSVDGKVLSSLRLLLLRPGALTAEYLRGRRARHLTPLRLYLLCSVGYFLVSSVLPAEPGQGAASSFNVGSARVNVQRPRIAESAIGLDSGGQSRKDSSRRAALVRHRLPAAPGVLDSASRATADSLRLEEEVARWSAAPQWVRRRLVHGITGVQRDRKEFGRDYQTQLPRLMFVLMPVSGLLLALAYRSRRRRYPVHLVVALHLHAFVFALLALEELRVLIPWSALRATLKIVALVWICAYLPLALRRVYGGRRRYAVLRAGVLLGEYSIIGAAAFALMAFALLLMY